MFRAKLSDQFGVLGALCHRLERRAQRTQAAFRWCGSASVDLFSEVKSICRGLTVILARGPCGRNLGTCTHKIANLINVRFDPLCGLRPDITRGARRANSGLMQCNKWPRYSITLSARATNVGGTVMPIALAVLRLITSSNLVSCRTGRSAGLAPRKREQVQQ